MPRSASENCQESRSPFFGHFDELRGQGALEPITLDNKSFCMLFANWFPRFAAAKGDAAGF
jgi:hypothetical protein